MEDRRKGQTATVSRVASVARAIAEEARQRADWDEAARFERIAAVAEARDKRVARSAALA